MLQKQLFKYGIFWNFINRFDYGKSKRTNFLLIPTKNIHFFFHVGLYEVNLITFLQKYISPVME